MIYDDQADRFLANVPVDNPNAKTKTQKLLTLLKHKEPAVRDNAIAVLTNATCQPKNRDAARQEGLIPLWLAILQSGAPHHQKHAGNCVQSLAYNDTNKDELREVGGIDKILKALSTTRTTVVEVAMNCVNTLILLSVNQTNREVLAQPENIKIILGCFEDKVDINVAEKASTVLLNLTAGKTGKTSLREAGAIPFVANLINSERPLVRDNAIKVLYNLTSLPENREEIRKTHCVEHLLTQLVSLPLPQNEQIVLLNLKMLSNLAFDRALQNKNVWFKPLVHVIASKNANCVAQSLVCLQNLLNDETSVEGLYKNGGLVALAVSVKDQLPLLQKTSLILGDMLAIEESQLEFMDFGGLDFLVPLLQSTELEIQKSALRAVSNLSIYYDEIRAVLASRGCVQLITGYIMTNRDREVVRRACMALINLALNHANEEMIFNSGILPKLLKMIGDRNDKEIAVLASKILVNLTTHEKIRKIVSEIGGVASALQMMAESDEELQYQGAKLVTNLAISGRNRKDMHDKGMVKRLEQIANKGDESLKSQIDIALDNCAFPFALSRIVELWKSTVSLNRFLLTRCVDEQKYEDLNFRLEEKMPQLPPDEEDDDIKEARQKEEEELNRQQREAESEALEEEKRKLEEEKRLAEEEKARRIEEEKRLEELEKQKAKEKEAELTRQREEDVKKRKDILSKRRADHQERIKQMEEEVRKREAALRYREQQELLVKREREAKERKEREANFAVIHKAEKRTKAIHEMVSIEKTYVSVLGVVIRKFLSPLQASSKTTRPIISAEKISKIFSITEVVSNLMATCQSR